MKKLFLLGLLFLVPACGSGPLPTAPVLLPVITVFNSDSNNLTLGASTVLHWQISDESSRVQIDPLIGNVPVSGSITVNPSVSTTYTLTATNSAGPVQRFLTITVK